MRVMLKWAAIIGGSVVAAVVLLAGTPAQSASAAPEGRPGPGVTRSTPPTGTHWKWGIQPAQLPECEWGSLAFDSRGGWSGRRVITEATDDTNTFSEALLWRPMVAQWDEPCYDSTEANLSQRIRIRNMGYSLPVAASPAPATTRIWKRPSAEIAGNTVTSALFCASSEWSSSYETLDENGGSTTVILSPGAASTIASQSGNKALSWQVGRSSSPSCPYLVGMRIVVCGYLPPPSYPGNTIPRCDSFVWMADAWYEGRPYSTNSLEVELCRAGTYSLECAYIDPPDEITWDSVCGRGLPEYGTGPQPAGDWSTAWSWIFTDWFPFLYDLSNDWVGHMARCLFAPPGGFDRHGDVARAWEQGGLAEAASAASGLSSWFHFTGGCGPIVDLGPIFGSGAVDTCTWAPWATQVREAARWAISIPFAIWFVVYVLTTARGLFGVNSIPLTPLESGFRSGKV